mmetsp:Transcript_26584/g.86010  ORF Transcript_26584/g.86010 Transcript_26584/m.86010 type:complete len:395 (+) Transcript_26584:164-1348(+)
MMTHLEGGVEAGHEEFEFIDVEGAVAVVVDVGDEVVDDVEGEVEADGLDGAVEFLDVDEAVPGLVDHVEDLGDEHGLVAACVVLLELLAEGVEFLEGEDAVVVVVEGGDDVVDVALGLVGGVGELEEHGLEVRYVHGAVVVLVEELEGVRPGHAAAPLEGLLGDELLEAVVLVVVVIGVVDVEGVDVGVVVVFLHDLGDELGVSEGRDGAEGLEGRAGLLVGEDLLDIAQVQHVGDVGRDGEVLDDRRQLPLEKDRRRVGHDEDQPEEGWSRLRLQSRDVDEGEHREVDAHQEGNAPNHVQGEARTMRLAVPELGHVVVRVVLRVVLLLLLLERGEHFFFQRVACPPLAAAPAALLLAFAAADPRVAGLADEDAARRQPGDGRSLERAEALLGV